jgi:uncharacterized protein (DUF362 family)
MSGGKGRVHVSTIGRDLIASVREALEGSGIAAEIKAATRIALKPNLTFPTPKMAVTTPPEVLRALVQVLRERTDRISIVESDGGYGAWTAEDAFNGHGLRSLESDFGAKLVNLCKEPSRRVPISRDEGSPSIPLPVCLLEETDLLISMPVPKIHCMTGLTLAFKNQWGCIPDNMRLRAHHMFNKAIVEINRLLKPMVLSDGTYFLDRSGPMEGDPVKMGLIIGASNPGVFDRYVSELMGFPWREVSHLKYAAECGDLPSRLEDMEFNAPPEAFRKRAFHLKRTMRNWIALSGFHSRTITWLGYESWFGKHVLHGILYALAGRPTPPVLRASSGTDIPRVL